MLRIFKQYYPIRNIFFVIGEFILISASVLLATWIILDNDAIIPSSGLYSKILLITITYQICFYYNDLYDLKITDSYSELSTRLLQSIGAASILLAGVYFAFPQVIIGRNIFIVSVIFAPLLIILWRFFYAIILQKGLFNQKIILLGSSELARDIIKEINEKKDSGYEISIVVEEDGNEFLIPYIDHSKVRHRKKYDGLYDIAKEFNINKIVVAIKQRRGAFPARELLDCRVRGIDIIKGNTFYEMLTGKLIVDQINPDWLIFSRGFRIPRRVRIAKRIIDILVSLVMLIALAPLIALVSLLIKIDSKGPIFFSQERVGEKRNIFKIHKFRSMVENAEKKTGPIWSMDNDDRITRVGRIIRKLRIDEIPQLWNVLKSEMSFVGPRPEREFFVKELEEKIPYYGERFIVKPGITGWAQVSYGYGASVDDAIEKLNYDLFYTKNFSIFMDLMIIARTVKIVLFGKGR
ncbi:MAG: sugar transferase [Desulfobacteraceae bacterium]|nr:MAG: sugar transferase [Desulfobacteraceae bacterium]